MSKSSGHAPMVLYSARGMPVMPLRFVHTDGGNGNGKNGLYWTLWVAIAFAEVPHVNTFIGSNVTHSSVAVVVAAVSVNSPLPFNFKTVKASVTENWFFFMREDQFTLGKKG